MALVEVQRETVAVESPVVMRLRQVQRLLLVLYAASLPLSLTLSWILFVVGLLVSALHLVIGHKPLSAAALKERLRLPPLSEPIAIFATAVTISGGVAGGVSEALASFWTLKTLLVYFWASYVVSTDRQAVPQSIGALLLCAGISGLWAMVQQLTGFHPFGYPYLQGTGFLGGPMPFAGQMQLFSLLSLGLLLGNGFNKLSQPLSRWPVFATIVVANCLGVFFASERSAWLGVAVGALAMAYLISWRTMLKCCAVLALIGFLSWATVPVVKQRLEPLANWHRDVGVTVRLKIWRESLQHWRDHRLTGVGIRRYPHFNVPEAIVPGHSIDLNHAHSNYIHILTTTGLAGLTAYCLLWISALALIVRAYRGCTSFFDRALALGIFGGTVALIVSGIFEYNFGASQVRLAQWYLLALLPTISPKRSAGEQL